MKCFMVREGPYVERFQTGTQKSEASLSRTLLAPFTELKWDTKTFNDSSRSVGSYLRNWKFAWVSCAGLCSTPNETRSQGSLHLWVLSKRLIRNVTEKHNLSESQRICTWFMGQNGFFMKKGLHENQATPGRSRRRNICQDLCYNMPQLALIFKSLTC